MGNEIGKEKKPKKNLRQSKPKSDKIKDKHSKSTENDKNLSNLDTDIATNDQIKAEIPINSNNTQILNDPISNQLNQAYIYYNEANVLLKQFSLNDSLYKFEESLKLINDCYSNITDEQLRIKVDMFVKQLANQIEFTKYQIKNQFEYKKGPGFVPKRDDKAIDYLAPIRNQLGTPFQNKPKINNNPQIETKQINTLNNIKTTDLNTLSISQPSKQKELLNIVAKSEKIKFSDIIGLEQIKKMLNDNVILPCLKPELFRDVKIAIKSILLFGPSGVGKNLIAKALATECNYTFLSLSASSILNISFKDIEQQIQSFFNSSIKKQPAIIYINEIELIFDTNIQKDNQKIKQTASELVSRLDSVINNPTIKIIIIMASNKPFNLDSSILSRFSKKIYISPFEAEDKINFIKIMLQSTKYNITEEEFNFISNFTDDYSNKDLKQLCLAAIQEPKLEDNNKLRPIIYSDFFKASKQVKATLNESDINQLKKWNIQNGTNN